jgi:hypothetical protein
VKVFLGGTCAKTWRKDSAALWRETLIPMLRCEYFNPVVPDWTIECQQEELRQRETCDFVLYTITPYMEGVYSIAEVADDSNKRPEQTLLCLLNRRGAIKFNDAQWKSLVAVERLVERNGARTFRKLERVADFLNEQ